MIRTMVGIREAMKIARIRIGKGMMVIMTVAMPLGVHTSSRNAKAYFTYLESFCDLVQVV